MTDIEERADALRYKLISFMGKERNEILQEALQAELEIAAKVCDKRSKGYGYSVHRKILDEAAQAIRDLK